MTQTPDSPPSPEYALPADPPAWPKAIGIISIVFASLSLLCGACGLFQNISAIAQGGAKIQLPNAQPVTLPPPPMLSVVLQVASVLWAIMLLIAGIMTLRRTPAGRLIHLVYAGVAIILTIAGTFIGWAAFQQTVAAVQKEPSMKQMAGMMQGIAYGSFCIILTLGLGYPAFLLVWFGAIKRRPEDMGFRADEPLV